MLRTREGGNRIVYLKTDNQQSIWVLYKKQSDGKICIYFAVTLPSPIAANSKLLIINQLTDKVTDDDENLSLKILRLRFNLCV